MKTMTIDMPAAVAMAFQQQVDAGWDGIIHINGAEHLMLAIHLNPEQESNRTATLSVSKLKAKR